MQNLGRLVCCRTLPSLLQSTRSNAQVADHNLLIINNGRAIFPWSFIQNTSTNFCPCHKVNLAKAFHTTSASFDNKIDRSRVPVLDENDLEESFVRGSGPGGQSVNRTSSACHLKHIPTGFVVKCHETRSLDRNRAKARLLMVEKLDQHFNGDMSVAAQMKRLQGEKTNKAQQKTKKKQLMKQMWKEREGID